MAQNARLRPKELDAPVFSTEDIVVNIRDELDEELDADGALIVTNPDGSVVVDFNPPKGVDKEDGFYANIADDIDEDELERIGSDLISDIRNDDTSRNEWLQMRERGLELLGFRLEDPRTDVGTTSAPLEGMSTVRHPLLSESVLRFQANARGELLPASGPVKVRVDAPPVPEQISPSGLQGIEDLADALETDLNHYLTAIAKEYYPDTDRMLFQVGFGGLGIKKVYNCPLRRRPVSESVDASDLIVSNAATDLQSSGRITHRIKMRPSILKRMQLVGAYRDVPLQLSSIVEQNKVEKKIDEIQGINQSTAMQRPEDQDQLLYETYCELDIRGYEHKEKGKETGLRLPYKVTIHSQTQTVLEVRRNWLKKDPLFMPREYFVDYAFVPAFGFYPIGLVHILGNTTTTLTAAWREMIDNGMFANFPGFIYAKQAGRQLSNQFRVPPGGGVGLDTGGGNIRDSIMPLPYKDVSAAFAGFIQHVEEYGQKLGSVAEMNIGEGKQDAPVGTTLALIEQATKMMDAVHKRLHAAQAKEFQLLKERFKEDPESFWRYNKRPTIKWERTQFLAALENTMIVPVADPNNPTSLHRIAKATAIKQLQQGSPNLYDPMAVDKRIMKITGVDPEGLFLTEPAPPPPDPRLEAIKAKTEQEMVRAKMQELQAQIKAATAALASKDKAEERSSRERIERMKMELERLRLLAQSYADASNDEREEKKTEQQLAIKKQEAQQKLLLEEIKVQQKIRLDAQKQEMELRAKAKEIEANHQFKVIEARNKIESGIDQDREKHESKLEQQDEAHSQKMRHTEEMHAAQLKAAKQMARVKPKTKKE